MANCFAPWYLPFNTCVAFPLELVLALVLILSEPQLPLEAKHVFWFKARHENTVSLWKTKNFLNSCWVKNWKRCGVCMAMVLSRKKGRLEPWWFNHFTNLPFEKTLGLKTPKSVSNMCSEIYLLKGCSILSATSCSAPAERLCVFQWELGAVTAVGLKLPVCLLKGGHSRLSLSLAALWP